MSRWSRLADLLREAAVGAPVLVGIAALTAEVTGADRAAVVLVDDGVPSAVVATDAVAEDLLAAEFLRGEGPAVTAHAEGRPILVPDVAADAERWPAYADAAGAAGVAATAAFPLRVGAARLGVLVALRDRPGAPDPEAFADALVVADLAVHAVLDERAAGPGGASASTVAGGIGLDEVQQAAGMTAERLGIGVADALVRIRAHAYAEGARVGDVGRRIVEGTLELEG